MYLQGGSYTLADCLDLKQNTLGDGRMVVGPRSWKTVAFLRQANGFISLRDAAFFDDRGPVSPLP